MTNTVVVTNDIIKVVSVGIQGPAGPAGATGTPGPTGAAGANGTPGDTILDKLTITPVLGGDLIPIIRGGSIYLATVADVLTAHGITPAGSELNFSLASNSGLLAGVV